MQKSSQIALVVAFLALLIGGLFYVGNSAPNKTPEELIRQSLADAQKAAQRGDVGGVMDVVSDDFRAGTWTKTLLRLQLARTLRASRGTSYDVHINQPVITPTVDGRADQRLVMTQFAAFSPQTGEDYYKSKATIVLLMRAETRRRYLFFREPYWRIVSMPNISALPFSDENITTDGL